VDVLSTGPAKALDLYPRKGSIQLGADADLVVVDPSSTRRVDPAALGSFGNMSAYDGLELRGWPSKTFLRGTLVAAEGQAVGAPTGRYLHRRPMRW
jgi:dihydroorotase-like cyclic amidohydrolase